VEALAKQKAQRIVKPKGWTQPEEKQFQTWYKDWAIKAGIDINPDNPLHKYDYRAAYRAGVKPEINPEDGRYHWPSEFKAPDHPNRFVNGIDTITGTPVSESPQPEGKKSQKADYVEGLFQKVTGFGAAKASPLGLWDLAKELVSPEGAKRVPLLAAPLKD